MNTIVTAAAVDPSTPSSKQQKQTAKEVIAANVQALIEQLEQGHSEALTAYLLCSAQRGHLAAIGCAGRVSTGAGMFSPQPLHRITKPRVGGGPWNMKRV